MLSSTADRRRRPMLAAVALVCLCAAARRASCAKFTAGIAPYLRTSAHNYFEHTANVVNVTSVGLAPISTGLGKGVYANVTGADITVAAAGVPYFYHFLSADSGVLSTVPWFNLDPATYYVTKLAGLMPNPSDIWFVTSQTVGVYVGTQQRQNYTQIGDPAFCTMGAPWWWTPTVFVMCGGHVRVLTMSNTELWHYMLPSPNYVPRDLVVNVTTNPEGAKVQYALAVYKTLLLLITQDVAADGTVSHSLKSIYAADTTSTVLSAAITDQFHAVSCVRTTSKAFGTNPPYIVLFKHEYSSTTGEYLTPQALYYTHDTSQTCSIATFDLYADVVGTDFIAVSTETNSLLVLYAASDRATSWAKITWAATTLAVDTLVNGVAHQLLATHINAYSAPAVLIVGQATTAYPALTMIDVVPTDCSWFDDSPDQCSLYHCSYCPDRARCTATTCVSCTTNNNPSVCIEQAGCTWCNETKMCSAASCTTCNATKFRDTCQSMPGCQWCELSSACRTPAEFCSSCPDKLSVGTCTEGNVCTLCENGQCISPDTECADCNLLDQKLCGQRSLYCRWCESTQTCLNYNQQCYPCVAVSLNDTCQNYPGCEWGTTSEACQPRCLTAVAYDRDAFISSFIEPLGANGGEVVAITADVTDPNVLYMVSMSPTPYIEKRKVTGEVLCSATFDTWNGTATRIKLDPSGMYFYVTGATLKGELEIDNAPVGLLASLSPETPDASLLAYTTEDCEPYYSIRWGSFSDTEEFVDLAFLGNGFRVLAATVDSTFPVPQQSNPKEKMCSSQVCSSWTTCGLVMVFSDTWRRMACYFTGVHAVQQLALVSPVDYDHYIYALGVNNEGMTNATCHLSKCTYASNLNQLACETRQISQPGESCSSIVHLISYDTKKLYVAANRATTFSILEVDVDDITKVKRHEFNSVSANVEQLVWSGKQEYFLRLVGRYFFAGDATHYQAWEADIDIRYPDNLAASTRIGCANASSVACQSVFTCAQVAPGDGTVLLLGGRTKDPAFITTTDTHFTQTASGNPLLFRVVANPSKLCVPSLPAVPRYLNSTALYPVTSVTASRKHFSPLQVSSGLHVWWPSFLLEWQASAFGLACDTANCKYLAVDYQTSDGNVTKTLTLDQHSTSVELTLLPFNYTNWIWRTKACLETGCVTSAFTPLSYAIDLAAWPDDMAEDAVQYHWEVNKPNDNTLYFPHTSEARAGSLLVRCVTSPLADTININVTTNHFVMKTVDKWLTFSVRGTMQDSGTEWLAGSPTVTLYDISGNYLRWSAEKAKLPSHGEKWWRISMPLDPDGDQGGIDWFTTHSVAPPNLDWVTAVQFEAYTNQGVVYLDIDEVHTTAESETDTPSEEKNKHVPAIVVPVTVSFFLLCVLVAALVVVVILVVRKKGGKGEKEMSGPFMETGMRREIRKKRELFDENNTRSKLIEFSDFPLRLSDQSLKFGHIVGQAPVDQLIYQRLHVSNQADKTYTFKFFCIHDPVTYDIAFEPEVYAIPPLVAMDVTIELLLKCTTKVHDEIVLAICPGEKWKGPEQHTKLNIDVEAALSTKLDPDEIEMNGNAIGETHAGLFYRGMYRGQEVCIKTPKSHNLEDFSREVELMETMHSPYILHFVGASHVPENLAIVTEFLALGDLWSCLLEAKKGEKAGKSEESEEPRITFSYALKVKCLLDCARGMSFLHHSGVFHRDLKPQNLMMVSLSPTASVNCKLKEFSSSLQQDAPFDPKTSTPQYMAPEVLMLEKYTAKADVFGFGVVAWQVFAEQVPYEKEGLTTAIQIAEYICSQKRLVIPEKIDPDVSRLIFRCWAADPTLRPVFDEIIDLVLDPLHRRLLVKKGRTKFGVTQQLQQVWEEGKEKEGEGEEGAPAGTPEAGEGAGEEGAADAADRGGAGDSHEVVQAGDR
eukprot:TRINITY_DN1029_c0_g1_i9.p1 TRINITY_DN1029_c0_g1~~TRINITY_DN1029_c0_g1_i9.p1  ORF type:complete len:1902 (-),score=319.12 TRINITY_DN1029_c0_g1_i9:1064-6769(-)